jgi:pimeloyl-ACP methyl ester carboxylesterase
MTERILSVNDVSLCIETFGDPNDPAVMLVHGACASMRWWDDEFCHQLAEGRRHVIRYDNRDTGRSTSYPPGEPGYSMCDMANDALGILDAVGLDDAHMVGRSMAGSIVIAAALTSPHRVNSLTLVGTSPGDRDLPPMTDVFLEAVANEPDYCSHDSIVNYIVNVLRAYAGGSKQFDETAVRAVVEVDVERTGNIRSALTNHFLIDFDMPGGLGFADLDVPTLVVHGDRDPVFPIEHAYAMQAAITGAELLVLDNVAHELPKHAWPEVVAALIRHTARTGKSR